MHTSRLRSAVAGAAAVAAVAGTALTATATGAAAGGAAPAFLTAQQLPPHASSPWYAGEVTSGLPDPVPFCVDDVLTSGTRTWHRSFHTDLDTTAVQVTVRATSAAAAGDLAADLEAAVAGCAEGWLADNPAGSASQDDLGTVGAGDGAHAWGVHTSLPESADDVHLVGVGRSGTLVTVVDWGQMGTLEDAPAAAFRTTTATAVNKL
jgi:hypothetical protein